jgi:hypothetical protein
MTSPLPPKFTYFNGSADSAVFWKKGDALSTNPLKVGDALTIEQVGERSRFTNPFEEASGAMQFFASTNSVQYQLAPRDKNAAIQVYNTTFFPTGRSAEFGLNEGGIGYVQTNGASQFNIVDPTLQVGDGANTDPKILINGSRNSVATLGRVYDTVYNRPVYYIQNDTAPWNKPLSTGTGQTSFVIPGASLKSGTYMLQVYLDIQDGYAPNTKGLELWVQRSDLTEQSVRFSDIHILPAMIIAPSTGQSNQPSFTSAVFSISNPSNADYTIFLDPQGENWVFGTSAGGLYVLLTVLG